jgi:hypothetical protein
MQQAALLTPSHEVAPYRVSGWGLANYLGERDRSALSSVPTHMLYLGEGPFAGGDVTLDADALYMLVNGTQEGLVTPRDIVEGAGKRAARARKVLAGKATPCTCIEEHNPDTLRKHAEEDERTVELVTRKIAILERAIAAAEEALDSHVDDDAVGEGSGS